MIIKHINSRETNLGKDRENKEKRWADLGSSLHSFKHNSDASTPPPTEQYLTNLITYSLLMEVDLVKLDTSTLP